MATIVTTVLFINIHRIVCKEECYFFIFTSLPDNNDVPPFSTLKNNFSLYFFVNSRDLQCFNS